MQNIVNIANNAFNSFCINELDFADQRLLREFLIQQNRVTSFICKVR